MDGDELAVRAVLGQQVTVPHARSLAGLLVERYGEPGPGGEGRLFPSVETLASVPPEDLPMPRSRGRALAALCGALAEGRIALDRSADRADVRRTLLDVPGIGPWTADYIAMRALGDPDVFLPTDVGVRRGLNLLGIDGARAEEPEAWRPWRSYAQMHVWTLAGGTAPDRTRGRAPRGERE